MYNLSEIRKHIYQYSFDVADSVYNIDLKNWKKNPYTLLKSIFYIETSSILVYFLLKTKVHPNTITLLYALCGVVGGVLLSVPNRITILLALFIFFTKGILDWSDGSLARITKRTSVKGGVLDPWGALINSLGFYLGLGFYVFAKSGNPVYLYLIAIILALRAGSIRNYTYQHYAGEIAEGTREEKAGIKAINYEKVLTKKEELKGFLKYFKNFVSGFLDDRARSVDFISLLILIEILYSQFFITWIVVLALFVKYLIIFLGEIFLVLKRNWIENTKDSIFK